MSKILKVSSSGYYKWNKDKTKRNNIQVDLDGKIKKVFDTSLGTYGSPRIAIELQQQDLQVSKNTVARRMRVMNLTARPKKKYVITTDSEHDFKVPNNHLNREFMVDQLNKIWVSDITYVRVSNYWMYLTVIIDLADRMVVGWELSRDLTANNTVISAFNKAVSNRGICKSHQLMFHSDRGVQYACNDFTSLLKTYNCTQSMSR